MSDRGEAAGERMLRLDSPDVVRRVRDVLDGVAYHEQGIGEAIGLGELPELRGTDVGLLLRRTAGGTPLETLVRLFLIGAAVDRAAAEAAIAPMTVDEWMSLGLLRADGDALRATGQILPFRNLLLYFDLPLTPTSPVLPDYVMGVGSSSITLANVAVPPDGGEVLDLGTGCGVLAFLAAPQSRRVVAVDRNPRAVNIAAFNALLNRFDQVECRQGNLFEPVEGEQFDSILSNPPFVVSPENRYVYRDGGLHGDQICQQIVRTAPRYLRPGGYCQLLCNWAHLKDQDWRERLKGWFAGTDCTDCDVWILRNETTNAATYASHWIRHTERDAPEDFDKRFDEWTRYYDAEGIEEISAGVIAMRYAPGKSNWIRIEDSPDKFIEPCGATIRQGFQLRDFLDAMADDRQLLQQRLGVAADVRLEQTCVPSGQGWSVASARLRRTEGLRYVGNADPYTVQLLAGCNGERTLDQLFGQMATQVGGDRESIVRSGLAVVRQLVERGFLLPVAEKPRS